MVKKRGKEDLITEKILEVVLDMTERMATKDDLEKAKNQLHLRIEEVLEELEPIRKAIDKDAETVVGHGKRISVLERRVGITTK